jgi:AhpD family alkylhydroperoxidase
MSWLPTSSDGATPLDRIFGLRANLYDDFRRFYALFWEKQLLDPMLLELCRLRVAALHGCGSELAVRYRDARDAGLDEEKIAALPQSASAPGFSEAERAAIAFAELFAVDPHAITDADAARVSEALGEPGMVALVEALALFDGFCRFRTLLEVEAESAGPVLVDTPSLSSRSLY